MWFQLNTTFGTHLGNLDKFQKYYSISYSLTGLSKADNVVSSIEKTETSFTTYLTLKSNYTWDTSSTVSATNATISSATLNDSTVTLSVTDVTGSVSITAKATYTGSASGGEDEDSGSTTYTFTVNPTPSTATTYLMKEENSVVSNNAITVNAGDEVFYIVTANNYVTVSGRQSNITSSVNKDVALTAYGASGTTIPITWHPQAYYFSAPTKAERAAGTYAILSPMDRVTADNSTVINHKAFWCTQIFTPDTLPNGSIITIADGYRYRPDGTTGLTTWNTVSTRPQNVTTSSVVVDDDWWNGYSYVAFNISNTSSGSLTSLTESDLNSIFSITLP